MDRIPAGLERMVQKSFLQESEDLNKKHSDQVKRSNMIE